MPEPYYPKRRGRHPLSSVVESRALIRVRCAYCKRTHVYRPEDLIVIFGDVETDSLMDKMRCEADPEHGYLDVKTFMPAGGEAVGLKIRRLVAIKIKRVPVWREE